MIEIVFSESASGSLKMAQHYGEGEFRGCAAIGVIIHHADGRKASKDEIKVAQREAMERKRLSWEAATPMGGNSADIFGFNSMLSVGNISEEQPSENLKKARERISTGEPVRIWYSNQPDEMCGLYWFMEKLDYWNVHDNRITIVKLPEWEPYKEESIVLRNSWGDVAPEEWYRYLELQKPASPIFIKCCALHWRELKKENSPLRAVINDRLVSVSEKLYDDFILREITAEGEMFHEARLIGRVLGYQLGINDFWISSRIEEMIRAGTLEIVSEAEEDMPRCHRLLKKGEQI